MPAIISERAWGGSLAADSINLFRRLSASASRGAARYIPTRRCMMRNKRPIVSFTFDDVPDTAFTNGSAILDRYGVKGTFYVAPGILGQADEHWRVLDREQLKELASRGHEIGCHTYSHVKVQTLCAERMAEENRRSVEALTEICGPLKFENFAYPFGVVSMPRKLQLQQQFTSCRGIYSGINSGIIDLSLLRSVELYDRTLSPEQMREVFDQTERMNGWLVLYSHDVADPPSWIGCTPKLMEMAVAEAKARGFDCVPVSEALGLIGADKTETA